MEQDDQVDQVGGDVAEYDNDGDNNILEGGKGGIKKKNKKKSNCLLL
jgi:hypothetical protein